jgi:hypothetical protein
MNFHDRFSKNTPITNFMNILSVGTDFNADGRTDMTKLVVLSRNFAKVLKTIYRISTFKIFIIFNFAHTLVM